MLQIFSTFDLKKKENFFLYFELDIFCLCV